MRYGYIRVSTKHQETARQEILMEQLGVDKVFIDKCTGKNTNRPQLKEMMSALNLGDVVVVESYSRMSRSTHDLLKIVEDLNDKGVSFISKKESVDTATSMGKMMLTFIAGINQFEREIMLERQKEGIAAMETVDGRKISKRTGRGFGRPNEEIPDFEKFLKKQKDGQMTVKECCAELGIDRNKWYREVKKRCDR